MKLFKDKTKVLILTHYTQRTEEGEDTDQRVRNYLKEKVRRVVHITHPLPEFLGRDSFCLVFENGEKVKELKLKTVQGPYILQYINHTIFIYYFLIRFGFSCDLCIAMENLSFVGVYPLRFLGIIKRMVYYSIDFVPVRFENKFLDWVYHFVYKFACKYSDINWVMAKQQIDGSRKIGITKDNSSPFDIVPIAYNRKAIDVKPLEKIDFYNITYAGAIRESMGPQLAVQVMPRLIRRFPKIHLTLVGGGKLTEELKKKVRQLKIGKYVDFTGYVEKFSDMTEMLSQKSIGLAPYYPQEGSFSFFSDPSKIKLYMVCGLPVITTNVTTMADLITKTETGVVINYSEDALYKVVEFFLSNQKRYRQFKNNAIKLSEKFDIDYVLNAAFRKIP